MKNLLAARWVVSSIGGVLLTFAGAQAQETITAVRFWSLADVTRIAVEGSGPFHFKYDRLDNPERLFFDISDVKPDLGHKGINTFVVGDQFVRQIRVAETQHGVTRVVLDLAGQSEFITSQLENPDRLIIELRRPGSTGIKPIEATPVSTDSSSARVFRPPTNTELPQREVPRVTAAVLEPASPNEARLGLPKVDPLSKLGSTGTSARMMRPAPPPPAAPVNAPVPALTASVTAPATVTSHEEVGLPARTSARDESMIRALGLKIRRIVIDAGHGGHDAGSSGPGGMQEKDLVLDVAKRLGALIEQRMGSEVIYTRSDDTFVPLEQRTEIANRNKADLFLSIHANSSSLRTATGIETYYLNFTTSKTALEVAARENATSEKSIYDLQDLVQKIALKDKVDESREFASRIQSSLYSSTVHNAGHARDRGVRKAPFIVLIGASMPSVLAEIGFISNPHDEVLMRRPDYRQKIAEALYKGLSSYAGTLSHFQVAQSR
ncbi:MAG TPA: N-acetylmuramoyl-L-alanine amidase [Bryobacteraceae bacterium]|nr:N-acetylmuramoyl-L-alanine amidase [Bryobacteraceae bacterium]